jgi:hypothetical protein
MIGETKETTQDRDRMTIDSPGVWASHSSRLNASVGSWLLLVFLLRLAVGLPGRTIAGG